ncbi:MAG: AMP-binding protein, partial [Burkholderiales bacterium]|nr:AMP-binding protein [Burkholderiales bacterium]
LTTTAIAAGFSAQRNFIRRGEPVPKPEDRVTQRAVLVGVPFFHVTGCHAILGPSLYNGSKLVTMHRWDTERAMALIERERCTQAGGVPTLAWQILEHPARAKYDLSSLESVSYGGAPAAAELVRRIQQIFPKAVPGTGWGMTETSATFTHHGAEDYQTHPDSCGLALPVCDMKIVDDAGRELPRGQVGEVWGKGPNVVKGYWGKPDASAETFVDGWVRTGDLARMDEEGFLTIVDRKKDMLIRGGENIYCVEVEDALYAHPAVMDAGVVGLPHRTLGEEPAAVVTLKPGLDASEQELRDFVRGKLAAYKVPVRIVRLRETLPRNANGKIIKKELRPLFGDAVKT